MVDLKTIIYKNKKADSEHDFRNINTGQEII